MQLAVTFTCRSVSLIGALLLLVAESRVEAKSLFAGVPSLGENKPKSYMQLTGRILLVFMFITMLRLELSVLQVFLFQFADRLLYAAKERVLVHRGVYIDEYSCIPYLLT